MSGAVDSFPRESKRERVVGAGPAKKYSSHRGRSYVVVLTPSCAVRAHAAQDSLARCANYAA